MAVMVDDRVHAFARGAHRRFHPHAAGLGFVGVPTIIRRNLGLSAGLRMT
jgi:hypothetical protein